MPSLLAIVEQILNGHVQESTAALDLLSSLHGKSLGVEVSGPGVTIVVSAENEKLRLEFAGESSATATVSGTPLALLASLRGDASLRCCAWRDRTWKSNSLIWPAMSWPIGSAARFAMPVPGANKQFRHWV
jgi:hypothetical protein